MTSKSIKSFITIERVAVQLREQLHIGSLNSPDMAHVLDAVPEIFPGFSVKHCTEHELPQDEAMVDFPSSTLLIRECVYRDAREGKPRARMTIAHEIGHIALGHKETRRRAIGIDNGAKYARQIRRDETEAKQFAAVFLVPTNLAKNFAAPSELIDAFQISSQAAEIRFGQIQTHNRAVTGKRKSLPPSVIDFLKEKRKRGEIVTAPIDSEPADD